MADVPERAQTRECPDGLRTPTGRHVNPLTGATGSADSSKNPQIGLIAHPNLFLYACAGLRRGWFVLQHG
jgi:hypothetical protein